MKLLTSTCRSATPDEFVAFWRQGYSNDPDTADKSYTANMEPFGRLLRCGDYEQARQHLDSLFRWKEPRCLWRPFLAKNWEMVRGGRLPEILADPDRALRDILTGGCIWPIFLLHCIVPDYPIYDQHVHRAMASIRGCKDTREIGALDPRCAIEMYLREYRPFLQDFAARTSANPRDVDRALWAYGKILQSSRWLLADSD